MSDSADTEQAAPDSSELLAVRREKLKALRDVGTEPYPALSSLPLSSAAEICSEYAKLQEGEDTEEIETVAGRLAARRGQGKASFIDLVDRSGRIQLHARMDILGEDQYQQLLSFDLGDLLLVRGAVFKTRRGELSLRVDSYKILAKSLRPPPEKHHGLQDIETRLRHRELDLIGNEESRERFIKRSKIISAVRNWLDNRAFIEVETPILQPLYGGAAARPFTTHYNALDATFYLRIAPELYLKRCIVGGLERVYELGKDFRNEGLSPKHNPEFTMLEAYMAYADYGDMMELCELMVADVAKAVDYQGEIDFTSGWKRETLHEAILSRTGIDIFELREREALASAMRAKEMRVPEDDNWADLVDELVSKYVEPELKQPTFIYDYPVEISPFARRHRDNPDLVERFEAYCSGMEIANAFTELNDPDEQRARFEQQRQQAAEGDEEAQPFDEAFLQALEQGMPPTGGIGIGIDRLVMILTGQSAIREVILFPALKP